MNTSYTLAQLEQFRRDAKRIAKQNTISHNEALDRVAASEGWANWSLLAKHKRPDKSSLDTVADPTAKPCNTAKPVVPKPVDTRIRYYLHGDQNEQDSSKYYCARCDLSVDAAHFGNDHPEGNEERFLSSLARWTRREQEEPTGMRRPADAPNLLAAKALAANAAYEASRSEFHRWIERQKDRDDARGDLASDIWRDRKFPVGASTLAEVQRHLELRGAASEAIKALKRAWVAFLKSTASAGGTPPVGPTVRAL